MYKFRNSSAFRHIAVQALKTRNFAFVYVVFIEGLQQLRYGLDDPVFEVR